MTDLALQELEEAYSKANEGNAIPNFIFGVCPTCRMSIILTRDITQICEHFKSEIEKIEL